MLSGTSTSTMQPNPFNIPSDDDIFRHREEEKTKKDAIRLEAISAPVADKSTFSSRMQATTTEEVRELLQTLRPEPGSRFKPPTVASTSSPALRSKDKENLSEFISKKREIFLLQMSLDTKRAEIKKLDERARQREEALKKSEQMLEEDALRFDAFLKENDEKVQEAIKNAETEAKAKQDKVRHACMAWHGTHACGRPVGVAVAGIPSTAVCFVKPSYQVDTGKSYRDAGNCQAANARAHTLHSQPHNGCPLPRTQVLEIKRLNTSTAALRSEMNKYEEQLEDCRKYQDFMDGITPAGE